MAFHKKSLGTLARVFGTKPSISKIRDKDICFLDVAVLPHPFMYDHKGHDFEKVGPLVLPKNYKYHSPLSKSNFL